MGAAGTVHTGGVVRGAARGAPSRIAPGETGGFQPKCGWRSSYRRSSAGRAMCDPGGAGHLPGRDRRPRGCETAASPGPLFSRAQRADPRSPHASPPRSTCTERTHGRTATWREHDPAVRRRSVMRASAWASTSPGRPRAGDGRGRGARPRRRNPTVEVKPSKARALNGQNAPNYAGLAEARKALCWSRGCRRCVCQGCACPGSHADRTRSSGRYWPSPE